MAVLFDEGFEGVGYEEDSSGNGGNWSETVSTGCTVDEDFDTTTLSGGTPTGWESDCLECVTDNANENARTGNKLDSAIQVSYVRIEIFTASALAALTTSGDKASLFRMGTNFTADFHYILDVHYDGTSIKWRLTYHDGGGDTTIRSAAVPTANTLYVHEIYYDSDNDQWEWRINSTVEANGTGVMLADQRQWDLGLVGSPQPANTIYFDNFTIEDAVYPSDGASHSLGGSVVGAPPPYLFETPFVLDEKDLWGLSPSQLKKRR